MAKTKISEYSATAANNTDINGIDIAEGCAPSGINDAIRTLMKQIKDLQAGTSGDTIPVTAGGTGATTAAAARTALGATTTGSDLFTSVSAAAARSAIGAGTGNGDVTTTGSQVLTNKTISGADNTLTVDGTNAVGAQKIIQSGSAKTGSYTLATTDVGDFILLSTGSSVTIPNSTFSAGDAVSMFNNTTGDITITCNTTLTYIGGTDADKATVALKTRGVATVLFIDGTTSVITGNVS